MSKQILKVKNLRTYFYTLEGVVKAVDDVSLSLGFNETLGIVGESGSGKTVFVLSILKLIQEPPGKILEGEVIFNGKNISNLSLREIRAIRGKDIAILT